jgi:hypothetical protein
MEKQSAQILQNESRKNERGAALVTVLMITFLLLVAVIALLIEASMNTANVTDATAEEQAYYAAESGIQSVIRVLRGNPDAVPNPLINPSPSPSPNDNKINYFKAVKLCTSNASCNCSTNVCSSSLDTELRLSRWLPYDSTYPDRVILGATTSSTEPAYTPQSGFAYKIKVENPDNVGNVISYNTTGKFIDSGLSSKTWTSSGTVTVSYVQSGTITKDVSSGWANIDLGKFVVSGSGTITERARFAINVNLTVPYSTTKVIRGYIEPASTPSGSPRILYDSESFIVTGSTITLTGGVLIDPPIEDPPGSKVFRVGYAVPLSMAETQITGTMTAPEPIRLLIRSTGFGPRGAQKQLETIIQKNYFNELSAPSPLTLIGPNTSSNGNFVFNPGTSTGTVYNGKDVHLKAFLPPIGVTNDTNLATVDYELTHPPPNKYNGSIFGIVSNVYDELPYWLQSPKNLDMTLNQLKEAAKASKRYFGPGVPQPANGDYGNNNNATGITYIDGNLEFSQTGGGILIVTGALTFKGGFNFNGLIIVTGANGINRTGGGSGVLQGNMVVAPYNAAGVSCVLNNPTCFLAPKYDISGGGGSEIVYNSNNVANGLGALSNFVKGIAEK